VGVSSGRAGNLRGMDHLTGVLNYLKVTVLPNKLPISRIYKLVKDNKIEDEATKKTIEQQLNELIDF
jgi:NAD(P)H-dependent FMN reductase